MPCYSDDNRPARRRGHSDAFKNSKDRTNKSILRQLNFWNNNKNLKRRDKNFEYKKSLVYSYYSELEELKVYSSIENIIAKRMNHFEKRLFDRETIKKNEEYSEESNEENKEYNEEDNEENNNDGLTSENVDLNCEDDYEDSINLDELCEYSKQLDGQLAKWEEQQKESDYYKLRECSTTLNNENNFNIFTLNVKQLFEKYSKPKSYIQDYEDMIKYELSFVLEDNFKENVKNLQNTVKESYDFKLLNNNLQLLVCIFDYLNTFDLIINVANVCQEWNNIIFLKKEQNNYNGYHLQLFTNRILSCMKKIFENNEFKTFENILELQKRYELNNLLDLYLYSGMFHLEYFYEILQNDYNNFNNEITFYIHLNCNLSHLLKNYTISKRKFKNLMITNDTDFYFKTKDKNYSILVNYENFDKLNKYLTKFILGNILFEKKQHNCSISFYEGIPLYLKFLNNITKQIEMFNLNENICCYYLLKMKEKANYFLNNIYNCYLQDFFVTNDVLLGLHLILLNHTYQLENHYNTITGINFTRLLQNMVLVDQDNNLQNKIKETTQLFPDYMQVDYLQLFINDLQSNTTNEFPFKDNISPFLIPLNAVQFLQEHIIDLSKVYSNNNNSFIINDEMNDWIGKQVLKYRCFLSVKKKKIPPKDTDLFFHFHLLHSLHYYQDCKKIHYFNFQQN